jgi:hypothetical protein
MLRSRNQRDLKRARLALAGLLLSFLVRIQTVDPSAFEMPDAPANEAGVFLFSREVCRKSASGPKRTWNRCRPMSAFGGKADAAPPRHAISRAVIGACHYAATHCFLVGSLCVFCDQPFWFAVDDKFAGTPGNFLAETRSKSGRYGSLYPAPSSIPKCV